MNQKAQEMGLHHTHFTNPIGLDNPDHFSSAADLARIALVAIKNPEIAQIVTMEKVTVVDVTGKIKHSVSNINTLVGKIPGVKGIKTGWTQDAGECLVSLVERDNHQIIISLLGSQNRFKETQEIIEWVFANFAWEMSPQ
jgi:serine-type D-Ala-D-Ala carboxypeptidase (penicillin-binding protein 5/6)